MTIAHSFWCPRHLYLDRPAETFALVHHVLLILGVPTNLKGGLSGANPVASGLSGRFLARA